MCLYPTQRFGILDISKLQPADNFLVIMDAIFENENLAEIPNEGQNQLFKIDQGSIYKNEFETGVIFKLLMLLKAFLKRGQSSSKFLTCKMVFSHSISYW